MERMSEFLTGFLLNAFWQITLLALVAWICSRLLRNTAARYRHALWVFSLLLALAIPLYGVFDKSASDARPNIKQDSATLSLPSSSTASHGNTIAHEQPRMDEPALASVQLLQRRRQPLTTAPILTLAPALLYALFVLFRLGSLCISWRRAVALRRSSYARTVSGRMRAIAARCQESFAIKDVPLMCSAEVLAPVTVGATDPLIILPESFYETLPEETLVSVLGHELAHVRRRDYALNLVYELLLLPISFHPLAKYIKRQIDRTRELACDEMVTERLLAPGIYARALLNVAGALASPAGRAFTLGIFDADILEERIMKLTQKTGRAGKRAGRMLTLTAVVLMCISCLTISTFSFELRTDGRMSAAVAHNAAVEDMLNETGGGIAAEAAPGSQARSSVLQARANNQIPSATDDAQTRAQAACDAGKRRAIESIPSLIQMLGDDRQTTLLRCWDNSRWSPALETFKQPSPGEQAAIALASMGSPALEPLTNALSSSSQSVRRNAAWAIGELTNMRENEREGAVSPLISLLGDADEWVRMAAIRALGEIRDERAANGLTIALADASWRVRELAAWSLGEMKQVSAVQALCRVLLDDGHVEVRETAAWALGEIRAPQASSFLKQALNDSESRVRDKAQWALSEIEDSDG